MILDEPFRGLDAMTKELMWEYYSRLYEEYHRTNFFVTTDIDEAVFLADRLLIMSNIPTQVRAVLDVDVPRPRTPVDLVESDRANEIKMRGAVDPARGGDEVVLRAAARPRPTSSRPTSSARTAGSPVEIVLTRPVIIGLAIAGALFAVAASLLQKGQGERRARAPAQSHRLRADGPEHGAVHHRGPARRSAVTAQLIDGDGIARRVRAEWKTRVGRLAARGMTPGLAVIMVGENPASQVYVRNKVRACAEMGIHSEEHRFPESATTAQVLAKIEALNARPAIHGILVQLPLPPHVEARRLLGAIANEKDVDGFGLYNVGGLVGGGTVFPPCTPYGVNCLLEYSDIPIAGQNVVVVGASTIVGKPMALMLMQRRRPSRSATSGRATSPSTRSSPTS